jgi:hypothetical protein
MWARLLAAGVGFGLMAAPAVLAFGGVAADVHRIAGPLATSVAVVAMAQVTRPLRWCNAVLGAALVAAGLAIGGPLPAAANMVLAGSALAALAAVRGRITDRFGGGWSTAWRVGRTET